MIDWFIKLISRFQGKSRLIDWVIEMLWRFRRLINFGICGVINTTVRLGSFALLYNAVGLPGYISHAVSFILGSVCGYFLNSHFTFHEGKGRTKAQAVQYVGIDAVLSVSSSALMKLMEDGGWNVWLVEIGLTLGFGLLHYVVYKFFVFKIRKEDNR